jgi:uncharacterized membrane protein
MAQAMAQSRSVTAAAGAAGRIAGERIVSVDFMRGLALVLMAIDHLRDFLTNIPVEPEDVAHTWPALFFTRWITHFCAPLFFFLAGTGASLYRSRTGSASATSRFLWTRGLWLVLLEFTIIEYAWTFVFWRMGGVIWSLGCSMILLAFLVRLPYKVTFAIGAAIVVLHDLFDAVKPAQLGRFDWLWAALHRKGVVPHTHFFVLFPLLPLAGVMMLGYVFGKLFEKPVQVRSRITFWIGTAATVAFIVLRAFNAYGNPTAGVARNSPGEWHVQSSFAMSVVSFLDTEKYPASLQYLLMTLGPALIVLAIADRLGDSRVFQLLSKPIVVFGNVPLMFYVLHLYLIHLAAILLANIYHQPVGWLWKGSFWMNEVPDGYGHGLGMVYAMWIAVLVVLYFPCAWFAGYRRRHKAQWWLSYF